MSTANMGKSERAKRAELAHMDAVEREARAFKELLVQQRPNAPVTEAEWESFRRLAHEYSARHGESAFYARSLDVLDEMIAEATPQDRKGLLRVRAVHARAKLKCEKSTYRVTFQVEVEYVVHASSEAQARERALDDITGAQLARKRWLGARFRVVSTKSEKANPAQ